MSGLLAVIPARGGSKGLPRKNILPIGGKPLLAWTIEAARAASCVARVVVSTDDDEIMKAALQYGAEIPFRRPAALSSDAAGSMDVLFHALDSIEGYEYVVLLQPTSPLRTAVDIEAAFAHMRAAGAPACVSLAPAEQSPYWMYSLGPQSTLIPVLEGEFTRRQDLPPVYVLNGALYVAQVRWLRSTRTFFTRETVGYVMPAARSLDIDTPDDFAALQQIVAGTLRGQHEV